MTCDDCKLWVSQNVTGVCHGDNVMRGHCHLWPKYVTTRADHWCGQHQEKSFDQIKEEFYDED